MENYNNKGVMSKKNLIIIILVCYILIGIFLISQNVKEGIPTSQAVAQVGVCVGSAVALDAIGYQELNVTENYYYDINATCSDEVIFSDDTSMFDINSSTGIIDFTPSANQMGTYNIKITATNSVCLGISDSETVFFNITAAGPILDEIPALNATEDEEFYYDFNTTSDLTLYFWTNTSWFLINGSTGISQFTPTNNEVGFHWIEIYVNDTENRGDQATFNFTVFNANDAPILDEIPNFTVSNNNELYEDQEFTYDVNATDPDNDTIEYLDNTGLFVINSDTGVILFTPTNNDIGNHTVTIYAVDGKALGSQEVIFEIIEVNDAPVIGTIGTQTVRVNSSFYYNVNATDEEDGSDSAGNLIFSDDTDMFNINPTTGEINFTTNDSNLGNHFINISVIDTGLSGIDNKTDSEWVLFSVLEANSAPYIESFSPSNLGIIQMTKGICGPFSIVAKDNESDVLDIRWYEDDVFTGTTESSYSYCPTILGSHTLKVTVSDGVYTVIEEWTININAVAVITTASGGVEGGRPSCKELWVCTDWTSCMPIGVQTRICTDVKNCGSISEKPDEMRECKYVSFQTCSDKIRNQNEILVDCGGVCKPCPSCNDNICNQGELCEKCKGDECSRDEFGNVLVDCGGPCPNCRVIEYPKKFPKTEIITLFTILIISIILIIIGLKYINIIRILILTHKAEKSSNKENILKYFKKIEFIYNNKLNSEEKRKAYPRIKRVQKKWL